MAAVRAPAELVRISTAVGIDESLVLGGFGNTSAKTADGRYMYVKASGSALKDMTAECGWRRLRLDRVSAILKDKSISSLPAAMRQAAAGRMLLSAVDDRLHTDAKPSIESCFHSVLDRYVIHLHPAAVLAYVCSGKAGRAAFEKLFCRRRYPPLYLAYADPGYSLAKRIESAVAAYKARYGRIPAVIFLQNHGLVVTAADAKECLLLVRETLRRCKSGLKKFPSPAAGVEDPDSSAVAAAAVIRSAFFQLTGRDFFIRHFFDRVVAGFISENGAARLCTPAAVTSEELMYAGGPALWLSRFNVGSVVKKLERRMARWDVLPSAFLTRPLGLFIACRSPEQTNLVKDVVCASLLIRRYAAALGSIKPLNRRQRLFINTIETCAAAKKQLTE